MHVGIDPSPSWAYRDIRGHDAYQRPPQGRPSFFDGDFRIASEKRTSPENAGSEPFRHRFVAPLADSGRGGGPLGGWLTSPRDYSCLVASLVFTDNW